MSDNVKEESMNKLDQQQTPSKRSWLSSRRNNKTGLFF